MHLLRKSSGADKDRLLLHLEVVSVERGVHGGAHEDDFDVGQALQHPLGEQAEDVAVNGSFVHLVY